MTQNDYTLPAKLDGEIQNTINTHEENIKFAKSEIETLRFRRSLSLAAYLCMTEYDEYQGITFGQSDLAELIAEYSDGDPAEIIEIAVGRGEIKISDDGGEITAAPKIIDSFFGI